MGAFNGTLTQDSGADAGMVPAGLEEQLPAAAPELEDIGENGERLPLDLQGQLISLTQKFCEEDRYSRRLEVQDARRAHFYWRGMQHMYWNGKNEGWQVLGPAGGALPTAGQGVIENSAVLYTTNIYQAFGLTIMAVLTQNAPSVRFEPQDPQQAADIETAKAADRLRKIIERANDAVELMNDVAYFAWNDSHVAARCRFDEDARTKTRRELITIHGALEVKLPITAKCIDDFVYLQHADEHHVAKIRDEVAGLGFEKEYEKKIQGGAHGQGQDVYERTARISVRQGVSILTTNDSLANLVTRQQTWMRPAAFQMLEDGALKQKLQELFPEGVRVRVDGGIYTGAWRESMDDHWSILNAMPGDGQYRNAIGTSEVSVQERFNDIINIAQDVYEKTIPAAWVDDQAVDVDGMVRQVSRPGSRYGFPKRQGEAIAASFFFEPEAKVSADMLAYAQDLMGPISQFLTGAFPALFGGEAEGAGGDTASGYAMARDQAMGRVGLIWRKIKRFWARIMEQSVRLAAKNREEDVSMGVPDEHGNVELTSVRIEELKGKVYCYPDSDENFPESWTQKRALYMAILQLSASDEKLGEILAQPENQEYARKIIGLDEMVVPGSDSRNKQMAEISILLKSGPIPGQPQPVADPLMGQAAVADGAPATIPGPPQSSVPVDPEYDVHVVEFETVKNWVNSAEGQKAKAENSMGFENVRLHGMAHQQVMQIQLAQAAAQAAAMQPQPGEGNPPA